MTHKSGTFVAGSHLQLLDISLSFRKFLGPFWSVVLVLDGNRAAHLKQKIKLRASPTARSHEFYAF